MPVGGQFSGLAPGSTRVRRRVDLSFSPHVGRKAFVAHAAMDWVTADGDPTREVHGGTLFVRAQAPLHVSVSLDGKVCLYRDPVPTERGPLRVDFSEQLRGLAPGAHPVSVGILAQDGEHVVREGEVVVERRRRNGRTAYRRLARLVVGVMERAVRRAIAEGQTHAVAHYDLRHLAREAECDYEKKHETVLFGAMMELIDRMKAEHNIRMRFVVQHKDAENASADMTWVPRVT